MTNFSQREVDLIIEFAEEKLSATEIARRLNSTPQRIRGFCKRNNINLHNGNFRYITEETKIQIVCDYVSGKNVPELSKKYPYSKTFLVELLHERNVEIRDIRERRLKEGRISNKDAFCDFKREADSYFFGLLLADGCVHSDNRTVSIGLKSEDHYILEQLQSWLGMTGRLYKGTYFNKSLGNYFQQSHLSFVEPNIYKRLLDQNMKPCKSLDEKLPNFDWLSNRHFWRGVIDGDGHVSSSCNLINLCGSYELCKGFSDYCFHNEIIPSKRNPILLKNRKSNLYQININCNQAKALGKHLYEDCNYFLERKLKRALGGE